MFKSFSHIYIEDAIIEHPRTKLILQKFKSSVIVPIKHYKDVFNRRGQDFILQKKSPKLILAKRNEQFLYEGSHFSPNFDSPHFYYNTLALNCIYDCAYCYLQGMFSSANLVLFVNWEDYFNATDAFLNLYQSLYLALSYDTDLLATESFFPATKAWIEFAETRPNLLLEIRTKSNNFPSISHLTPIPNVILAWTLSPENIITKIEKKTPSLSSRLQSIQSALDLGWKVRICIDPMLREPNWKEEYRTLISRLESQISINKVYDISIGTFRMNSDFFGKIQEIRNDTALLYYPFERKNGIVNYSKSENDEMLDYLTLLLKPLVEIDKIKVSF
ncbi:MAG: DNA photolyase [Leptospira sp.]|nr:DNA photolyase [Leptospira sp.]